MKNINYTLLGLRGLLALSVVIYHIYGSAAIEGYIQGFADTSFLSMINYAGPISVDLFFVISGYLITQSIAGKRSVKEFIWNRILRIYPVFLTIHIIIFIFGPFIGYKWMAGIGPGDYVLHFISNALLLPGMLELPIAQIVAWSLSYELFFYIMAVIARVIYRSQQAHRIRKYFFFLLFVIACIVIVYYRPDTLFFGVGVALHYSQNRIKSIWKPSSVLQFSGFICLLAIYMVFQALNHAILPALLLSFLLFVTIIMEYGWLSRFLRTRPMRYLGTISFSLYMWHTMVMFPLKSIVPKISSVIGTSSWSFVIYALLSLIPSIIVAHISYQLIEVRFTKYVRVKRGGKPAAVKPVSEGM
ncbi:acyltransferase family protein [Paenibacillus gorillae]|uniref:acyltransferase family protein n=1 Tax=Paenibacillus gorillae TaxID=1243662 RepID=UPI0004B93D66|nr:acyltransferase [Paenibacillus gorillae]